MFCKNCGKPLDETDEFCKECGFKVSINTTEESTTDSAFNMKSTLLAVLAFFIPLFGFIFWLIKKDNDALLANTVAKGAIVGLIVQFIGLVIGILLIVLFASFVASIADELIYGVSDFMNHFA